MPITTCSTSCLCTVLLAATYVVAERARGSPFGRVLRALRDDPQVAAVAGKAVVWFQVRAFALGGVMIGLAGAMYGHFTRFVAPDIFVPLLTIYIFLAVTLGGKGSNAGTLIGTFTVVFLLESTRFATEILPWRLPGADRLGARYADRGLLPGDPAIAPLGHAARTRLPHRARCCAGTGASPAFSLSRWRERSGVRVAGNQTRCSGQLATPSPNPLPQARPLQKSGAKRKWTRIFRFRVALDSFRSHGKQPRILFRLSFRMRPTYAKASQAGED